MIDFNAIIEKLKTCLLYQENAPLIFNTGLFLVLFLIFYFIYILTYKNNTFRVLYVLSFSLYFYYKSSGIFFGLLILSTVWDYLLGLAIYNCNEKQTIRRKFYLILSIIGNLGLLFYFKYTNLFIDSLNQFGGTDFASLDLVLPVGISFYTFQTMSYSIDVYRGELKPEKNIFDFCFFVSFFPQLVAGPIVRAKDFIAQIRSKLHLTRDELGLAFWLILLGLLKKAIISDYISTNFVDRIFSNPLLYTGTENLLAVYGYTIQIYCDFSGYSDMAIGISLLMGFKLAANFNAPYQSLSITEFWKRWHISLSSWLKDYLYISLGGNRSGSFGSVFFLLLFMSVFYLLWPSPILLIIYSFIILSALTIVIFGNNKLKISLFTYINLMVTMLLGGFWHGASWRFVVWGALHGAALALERAFKPLTSKCKRFWIIKIIAWFLTFHFVAFCWIFFRAASFEDAGFVIDKILFDLHIGLFGTVIFSYSKVFILIGIGYLIHFLPSKFEMRLQRLFISMPLTVQTFVITFYFWLVIQIAGTEIHPFIYFQF